MHAVLGNNDVTLRDVFPERLLVELDGVRVGMVHDSGLTKGRAARMHRAFPDCGVVVFGHSHAPVDELGVDGQRLFNPGHRRNAACNRTRRSECSTSTAAASSTTASSPDGQ